MEGQPVVQSERHSEAASEPPSRLESKQSAAASSQPSARALHHSPIKHLSPSASLKQLPEVTSASQPNIEERQGSVETLSEPSDEPQEDDGVAAYAAPELEIRVEPESERPQQDSGYPSAQAP